MSKKLETYIRYTTKAAWDYATKKMMMVSFEDPNDSRMRVMNSKKIKIVVKIFEVEDE